jgi:uncharacterized repeat protein (TIGR01451 family)
MSGRTNRWLLCLGLLVMGMLLAGGTVTTGAAQPRNAAGPIRIEQVSPLASEVESPQAPALTSVGMGDLMSQTFEFGGAFPAGWQVYDAISPTVGLDYFWSTTAFTRAEGASSAVAVQGGLDGATLTDTADYTAAVDSWMVYGPVSLASVWQAQLGFAYTFTPTASGAFTVGVSTDYDPISRTGTFSEMMLAPTAGWTTTLRDLSSYAGQKVYVAFRYQTTDGGNAADGPFVDDVHVRANYRAMFPLISKWMLALGKSASSNVVWAGQSLVYSLTVYNKDTAAASGVLLTDTVPTGTVFVSADGGGTFNAASRVVSWSGLTMPAQSSVVRHLTITVPSGDLIGFRVVNKDYAISVPPNPMTMFGLPITTPVAFDSLDDFSNPASGWPIGSWTGGIECYPPPGSWRAGYMTGGTYGVNTGCAWNGMVYPSPVRIADTTNFTLEVDLRSNQEDLWYSSYGVFFNGSEDLRQMYIVRLFQGLEPPEFAIYRWQNFQGSSDDQPPPIMHQWGTCNECDGRDYAWNHIVVRRRGAWFEVYMGKSGGALARQATIFDDAYIDSNHARVGVHHGNFEWRGDAGAAYYAYVFDNFRLSPATR